MPTRRLFVPDDILRLGEDKNIRSLQYGEPPRSWIRKKKLERTAYLSPHPSRI